MPAAAAEPPVPEREVCEVGDPEAAGQRPRTWALGDAAGPSRLPEPSAAPRGRLTPAGAPGSGPTARLPPIAPYAPQAGSWPRVPACMQEKLRVAKESFRALEMGR